MNTMNTPVYDPSIGDDAAKALYNFCTAFNKRNSDSNIRVLGYLHGNTGAKLRIEPIETCSSRDIAKWKTLASRTKCKILSINVNAAEGHVDIVTDYNLSKSMINIEWQTLLLPLLILLILIKYTGVLYKVTGFQI